MKSDKYFFAMSVLLFIIMMFGFAHSFFFRSMLHRGPLPPLFIVHSVLNVGWLAALVSQSWLAMNNKIINHRRNGIYWFILSFAVVLFNCVIVYETAHKPMDESGHIVGAVMGNSMIIIVFICYVGLSYLFRHRPDIHKRLLLAAVISMLGPALSRFERYEFLRFASPEMNLLIYGIAIPQALLLSILIYDIITRKRPHFVSVIILLGSYAFMYLFYLGIVSGAGVKYVEFLKSF